MSNHPLHDGGSQGLTVTPENLQTIEAILRSYYNSDIQLIRKLNVEALPVPDLIAGIFNGDFSMDAAAISSEKYAELWGQWNDMVLNTTAMLSVLADLLKEAQEWFAEGDVHISQNFRHPS